MRILPSLSAALLGSVVFVATAQAADIQTPEAAPQPGHEWTFTVTPYLWMAGINGDTGIFGRDPVHIDESFGDVLKDLRFAGMVVSELHNGSWGVLNDVMVVVTKPDGSVTSNVDGVPTTLSASLKTTSVTGTLMGEYRVYSEPKATLDVMAGARLWYVNNDLDVALSDGGPPLAAFSGSDGATWVDPMVGIKGRYNINDKWFVNGWGMVGGFGAGSKVGWDAMAGIGYQYNDRFSFAAGYRALGVDYDRGGFVYDVVEHGPILGTIIKF